MMNAYDRWSAFLDRIAERHGALRAEAEAGAREALVACGFDPAPIAQVVSVVGRRLTDLEGRIEATWAESVRAAFAEEATDSATMSEAYRRGRDLAFALELEREALEVGVMAEATRTMHARAVATQKERSCPFCGAPLEIPFVHRAVELTCRSCRSLVTFEPGALARNAIAWGAHPIAREAARDVWRAMREAERRAREARTPTPLSLLKDYERAQIAFHRAYFGARTLLEPGRSDVDAEVRARMDRWYLVVDSEAEWIGAGKPREAL